MKDRHFKLGVWCNEAEKKAINDNASLVKMSISMYLRKMGLIEPVKQHVNHEAIEELCKIHGDLGRWAGLLNMWLKSSKPKDEIPSDIKEVMQEFRVRQSELKEQISQLLL